jgi:hypothetical protein
MKIPNNGRNFDPCPEFTGRAVIVDVTPLRKQQSQYGERDVFKVVFEVDAVREDGSPFCVWSKFFTPSLNEKANLRKFVRGLYGRDLTRQEMNDFDTECLIGKTAQLVVVHEFKDGETYANIASCTHDKSGNPLKPSGKYVRVRDRQAAPVGSSNSGSGYRRAEGMQANGESPSSAAGASAADLAATKIHVGKCKGLEVRDLSPDQVGALIEKWLPTAKANAKPTADDRRLIAALEWWQSSQAGAGQGEDEVPF